MKVTISFYGSKRQEEVDIYKEFGMEVRAFTAMLMLAGFLEKTSTGFIWHPPHDIKEVTWDSKDATK